MKTTLILTSALTGGVLLPALALAGPFGLPDHQPDGYRDTGCDPAFQVQITNEAGKYLYSNNPTCPAGKGATDVIEVIAPVKPVDPEEPEEPTED